MKKFFAIAATSLFLTAICTPVVTVSAQEPQKKECTKADNKECSKDTKKCDKKNSDKKACCNAKKNTDKK